MTQTGFIFRAGRTPVNGRTIANKVGASVRKRKTTGTHHFNRDPSSALNRKENMLHHEMNDERKLQGKSHKRLRL